MRFSAASSPLAFTENLFFPPVYFFEFLSNDLHLRRWKSPSRIWRCVLKIIASVIIAVTAMASPAFARKASHHVAHQQGYPVYQGYPLYDGNAYLGSDPDPQVQFDLEREAGSRNGGY